MFYFGLSDLLILSMRSWALNGVLCMNLFKEFYWEKIWQTIVWLRPSIDSLLKDID